MPHIPFPVVPARLACGTLHRSWRWGKCKHCCNHGTQCWCDDNSHSWQAAPRQPWSSTGSRHITVHNVHISHQSWRLRLHAIKRTWLNHPHACTLPGRSAVAAPMASGSPTTMLSTPSGMPARRASSASASAVSGVLRGLQHHLQPVAMTSNTHAQNLLCHTASSKLTTLTLAFLADDTRAGRRFRIASIGTFCVPSLSENVSGLGARRQLGAPELRSCSAARSEGPRRAGGAHGAAGGDGGRDLARDHGHGEVPGRDGGRHADRLPHDQLPHVRSDRLQHVARHAPRLLRKPLYRRRPAPPPMSQVTGD